MTPHLLDWKRWFYLQKFVNEIKASFWWEVTSSVLDMIDGDGKT